MLQVERDTEILIDNQLRNLGWINDPKSKDRNVYLQRVRSQADKEKLEGKRPDYVLYQSNSNKSIAIIEAKKPGQNIHEAINQGLKYAERLETPLVFATDGIYTKTIHTKFRKPLRLNNDEINELLRESLCIQFISNNEINTLDKRVVKSRSELISIFKTSNDYLRAEGLRSGDERFTEFSNILFLKLISEMEDIKDELGNRFDLSIIDKEFRWNSFKQKRGKELLSYVNDSVLRNFQLKYGDSTIFKPLSLQNPKTLERIIDSLNDLQLTDINADIKGDAFEHFLKSYNAGNKDLGEYFTPRHIVQALVKLINPQLGETVYDPFCGTGGMLIESFRHIQQSMPNSSNAFKMLKERTIYGNEITNTARITKMNMILIGDGHSNIRQQDSLANPLDNQHDMVITNMPFAQSTEYQDLYDIPMSGKKNGDSICIQHCIKATKEGGRIGAIVPEGFLFDKKYQKTREYILNKANLERVISLPQGCFLPYTGVKTDILLLTNLKQEKVQSYYWYFNVKNDGYTLNNRRDKIEGDNDLDIVLSERKLDEKNTDYLSNLGIQKIDINKVKEDSFNFVGSRHLSPILYSYSRYPMKSLGDVIELLRGPFGSSIKKELCVKSGYKVYEQGNVINKNFSLGEYYLDNERFELLKKFEIQEKDILITCAGTLGKVAIVPKGIERGIINSVLMRMRIKDSSLLPQYLLYLLESNVLQNEMVTQSMGTSIKNMRPGKEIKELLIPIPPMEDQLKTIKELEEIEKSINHAQNLIESLKSRGGGYPQLYGQKESNLVNLGDLVEINPRNRRLSKLGEGFLCSFVPMEDLPVRELYFYPKKERSLNLIQKGYTYFEENDLLLAKITPCFENGKMSIARNLKNGFGFGSTEFIVLRSKGDIKIQWVYSRLLSDPYFIENAKQMMKGSSGHRRVSLEFLENYKILLPSLDQQENEVKDLEENMIFLQHAEVFIKKQKNKLNQRISSLWN